VAGIITPPTCPDAVIVLPGIMGSELVERETDTVLWGLSPRGYVDLWTRDSMWERLKVSQSEREGKLGRISATRLLQAPAFAPVLRGVEPYSRLVAAILSIVNDRDAVLEFPYDWRLSVKHNASELAKAADRHLTKWRAHRKGSPDAKLVLVAHSMGGLVAQFFTGKLEGHSMVRQTISIGAPFWGAVKAVFLLDQGWGSPVPLPRQRLLCLAKTLPGIYDLLPSYRCVVENGTTRRLTPADVERLGGDLDLARASSELHDALSRLDRSGLRTLVGVEQPTMQSLLLRDGVAEPQFFTNEDEGSIDWRGDGTVYTQVAAGGVEPVSSLPQSHGALARSPEAIAAVRAVLTRRRLGPPMGAAGISLDVPDTISVDQPFDICVTSQGDPGGSGCRIVDADTNLQVSRPFLVRRGDAMVASARLLRAGLYRVEVQDGGYSAVTQLIMALSLPVPVPEVTG